MTKKLFFAVLITTFFANICMAQSSSSQSVTNPVEPVDGIQLSISLSNNIFIVGSSATVQYRVKNSSTNLISWLLVNEVQGLDVFLTTNKQKVYFLTPEPDTNSEFMSIHYALAFKVKAGGTYGGSVPISIGKNIKPGIYQLEAKLSFRIAGKRQANELISNLIEVHIK